IRPLGVDDEFLVFNAMKLNTRAEGFGNDQEVWAALRAHPDYAVVDSTATGDGGFGQPPDAFRLPGVQEHDTVMAPARVEIQDPTTGLHRNLTIIGVLSTDVAIPRFMGLYMPAETFQQVFTRAPAASFFIKTAPG